MERVVVTGMGLVSCFGCSVDRFHTALMRGDNGVTTYAPYKEVEFSHPWVAPADCEDGIACLEPKWQKKGDPFLRFAMIAAHNACTQAGIDAQLTLDPYRCGVIIGSGIGGVDQHAQTVHTIAQKGAKRVSPFYIPYALTNMAGGLLAIRYGMKGSNYAVSTACASANHALLAAYETIARGDADLMLAGGSEATVHSFPVISGFAACKALSSRGISAPFDANRDGFVLGEGAGILVLESLTSARMRNVPIYAELCGGWSTCDAHHMTQPHPQGEAVARCMHEAMARCNIAPSEVGLINAHATSTPAGDRAEVEAIKQLWPKDTPVITATKSMTGHALGAAGGLEAIATILCLRNAAAHPTINIGQLMPEVAHLTIAQKAEPLHKRIGLSNAFGFGGHNCSLLFR